MNYKDSSIGGFLKKYAILLVLIALIIFFCVRAPGFTTLGNLFNIARQVSTMGIAAVGCMFVLLIGGIDLSIGSLVAFINIVCAVFLARLKLNIPTAVIICLLLAVGIGALIGVLVTKLHIPPFIATLAFMSILSGVALTICKGLPISGFPTAFKILGQGYVGIVPVPVIIMIVVFAIGAFILNKTIYGRYFYAIGGNEEAARLSGIKVQRIKIAIYALSSLFAAIAAILLLSRLNSGSPQTGDGFEFNVITACVVGGVSISGGSGRISGVIIGVLIMGVLSAGLIMINVNEFIQMIIKGIILCIAVGVDYAQKNSKKRKILTNQTA
ncbi:ribose ABC transporter permease [Clostridia bacterium]|nr:ribose ABC transporter permease [Clostridia bacterium]